MLPSSKGTLSTRPIIKLADPFSSTSAVRLLENHDLAIYKPAVRHLITIAGSYQILILAVIQILMQATNGLGVILENRYYGESYPFNTSTTDNLAYMTTEQSLTAFLI